MLVPKFIPICLLALAGTVSAAPRFALVRVKDIYTALPATAEMQQQIAGEREQIMKDERAEQLRKIIAELQAIQDQLGKKDGSLDDVARRELAQTYEIKRQEAQTLQQEFESFRAEQEKSINRRMVAAMRASLNRIVETSRKLARERGYDAVFDSSGRTNTDAPFILYSKDAPDLTEDIQAALKDSAPPPKARPVSQGKSKR